MWTCGDGGFEPAERGLPSPCGPPRQPGRFGEASQHAPAGELTRAQLHLDSNIQLEIKFQKTMLRYGMCAGGDDSVEPAERGLSGAGGPPRQPGRFRGPSQCAPAGE